MGTAAGCASCRARIEEEGGRLATDFAVTWDLCPREVNGGYQLAIALAIAFPVLGLLASLTPGRVRGPALVTAASSPAPEPALD
jgi:hypothetical protein